MKSSPNPSMRLQAWRRIPGKRRLRPFFRRSAAYGCLACALAAPAAAQPTAVGAADADELAADQISVRELIRLETALALSQAQKKLQGASRPGDAGQRTSGQSAAPRLVAIYGVGKKLAAEVRIGADTHLYMNGHPLPVGQRKAGKSAYTLRAMDSACVRLERESRETQLCLAGQPIQER
ncbi:MAG TPA: hypothetical protein VNT00_00270 [Eoetvoesiella sp.]|uniref:hypothetical protein n=1 Tax=Eoetvoesiella sp. TaxID=1966355 RepID=UPI002C9C2A54|nr:hypothetical protein [Eoetvoesiella sp.]HWK59826.1 hypothetical protein [Eoetvoesiella sp.]